MCSSVRLLNGSGTLNPNWNINRINIIIHTDSEYNTVGRSINLEHSQNESLRGNCRYQELELAEPSINGMNEEKRKQSEHHGD